MSVNTPACVFPLRVVGGRFAVVEQGSLRHLEDQADILIRTRPGDLDAQPEFGLRELIGTLGPVAPAIRDALDRHVDSRELVEEDESRLEERIRTVAVQVLAEDEADQ